MTIEMTTKVYKTAMSDTSTLFVPAWAGQAFDDLTFGKFNLFPELSANDWADWIRHRLLGISDICVPGSMGSEDVPYAVFSQIFRRKMGNDSKPQSRMLEAIEHLIWEITEGAEWHNNSGKMLFLLAGDIASKDPGVSKAAKTLAWQRGFVGVGIQETDDTFLSSADLHYYLLLFLSETDAVKDAGFWLEQVRADERNVYGFVIFKALSQVSLHGAVEAVDRHYFSEEQMAQLMLLVPDLLEHYGAEKIRSVFKSSELANWGHALEEEIHFLSFK